MQINAAIKGNSMRTSQNINNRAISNSATVHIHKGNELCMLNYICPPSARSLPHHTQWLKSGLPSSRSVYKGQVEYSHSVLISNLWKKASIYDNMDEPGIRTSETWIRYGTDKYFREALVLCSGTNNQSYTEQAEGGGFWSWGHAVLHHEILSQYNLGLPGLLRWLRN